MRFSLQFASVSGLLAVGYAPASLAQLDVIIKHELAPGQSIWLSANGWIAFAGLTALVAFTLGLYAKQIRQRISVKPSSVEQPLIFARGKEQRKQQRRNESNYITPAFMLQSSANDPYARHSSFFHVRKHWVCHPVAIIVKHKQGILDKSVDITFNNAIPSTRIISVRTCPVWFNSVIEELLYNVIKHNACKRGVRIVISTFVQNNDFGVTVSDNGAGLSDAITQSLTNVNRLSAAQAYAQLHGPINLLSINNALAAMGGSLEVSSARQFLTKVALRLPLITNMEAQDTHKLAGAGHYNQVFDLAQSAESMPEPLQYIEASATSSCAVVSSANDTHLRLMVKDCIANYNIGDVSCVRADNLVSSQFIEKFNELLLAHYGDESFAKSKAASIMSMTDKTLTRKLHRHYNVGFVDMLRQFRLHKATHLLLVGENVTNVAFDTGFSSASYFTQCFKLEFGFAPSLLTKYAAA